MAKEYDNEKSGVLFKNDRKEKETHPDYKGNCTIEGVDYWVSGWRKGEGEKMRLSLSFQKKDGQATKAKAADEPAKKTVATEDIPF